MPLSKELLRIGVLASHNGSAMQAIYRAIFDEILSAKIVLVVSNNSKSGALAFAKEKNIENCHLSKTKLGGENKLDEAIALAMIDAQADIIVLSGWMQPVGEKTLKAFPGKIINIHPALRDSGHEGRGYYGDNVHAAVLAEKRQTTGATIHLVSEEYDEGEVLLTEEIAVQEDDTVESLRERIKALEQKLIVQLLLQIVSGETVLGEE